jgi:glutaminase
MATTSATCWKGIGNYIPILDIVPSDMFGVVIITREGDIYSARELDYEFSIQSVSKPATAAFVI